MQFQQNMITTIQDLKTQIGQLANTLVGSSNLPSQTIPNLRGNASVVTLRSGKELPQPTLQQLPRPTEADAEPNADSKLESDEELLKMFPKVEINIPLLDTIKQIPKYAKFFKELCVQKRKKIKGSMEALTRNEEFTAGAQQALPKKCQDPGISFVPCTIGDCTFADAMLDLGASIDVMPTSIYKSLNFGDLEPTGMTIQLANISVVQPLGVLEYVLVQVNELIFLADFYSSNDNSSSPPPLRELKPLPNHLKYAYLNTEQQLPVIIANNLRWEQEDKLLNVLRQHKKEIGWKLSDLPAHKAIAKKAESNHPGRGQERSHETPCYRIIYPISDSQWVSPMQVVPKKSGMTFMKNQQDELVPMRIQNSWQATRKDHFPLPFIDQVLEKLSRKSHYCFLDGFSRYMQIHIAPEDQHKTTFTCPFGTFAYTRMPFGLCNAPSTFQRCMTSIFSDLL
ncbi:hypothetical protein CR513_36915, partial [Mucuna pruriens]